jgi:hypothetical protein
MSKKPKMVEATWRDIAVAVDDHMTKLSTENAKLRAALRPFANALQGHYHHQVNEMPIVAGYHKDDLRFKLTLGDFREACAALGEKE